MNDEPVGSGFAPDTLAELDGLALSSPTASVTCMTGSATATLTKLAPESNEQKLDRLTVELHNELSETLTAGDKDRAALLWERMRALFYTYALASMRQLFEALFYGLQKPTPVFGFDST